MGPIPASWTALTATVNSGRRERRPSGIQVMRAILSSVVLLSASASAPALAQGATPEAGSLLYGLKRICGWHVEGTSLVDLFKSEIKLNGWTQRNVGGRVSYDKSGDWGAIKVIYGTTDTQSRCSISVTPADTATLAVDAMRAAVASFLAERFPGAQFEKDRAPATANAQILESVWTEGHFTIRLGEMPAVARRPILQVHWDRSLF